MPLVRDEWLDAARQAVREAGRLQLAGLTAPRRVDHKGRFDLVTDVDRRCEEVMSQILHSSFPQAGIVGEEDTRQALEADDIWLIDPLDGTTNYAHGFPFFCSTVALRRCGQTLMGVVFDPLRQELFEAVQGRGALLNGSPIRASLSSRLEDALLATGFPYDRCEQPDNNLDRFAFLTMRTRGVRRCGSAALDLCYTACGRLDGYWEVRIQPWDVCAGALMVEEAGGRVSNLRGGPFDGSGKETLASNGRIHQELTDALAAAAIPPAARR